MREYFAIRFSPPLMIIALVSTAALAEPPPAPIEKLPAADQILEKYVQAVGGRDALEKLTTRVCKGKLIHDISWYDPSHQETPIEAYAEFPDKWLIIERKIQGERREGSDGQTTWALEGDSVMIKDHPDRTKLVWLLDPRNALRMEEYFPGMVLRKLEKLGERTVYVVEPTGRDMAHYGLYFDAETGVLLRIGYYMELQDYRKVDGIRFPFRITNGRKGGSSTYVFDEVKHNVLLEEGVFRMVEGE